MPGHKHLTLKAFHSAGGQGVVYRAEDSVQGKEVAVKLLARNLSEEAYEDEIDRFAREKAAMDFISHAASLPMFVDVYDFHRGSQEPDLEQAPAFLEMEFIQWPTLGNVIREHGKLPVDTVFLVALELAQALRIMSRRIIHNDIKPHNLFVNIKRDKVDLKVGDFGIWVPDDDKVVTQVGAGPGIAGTIAYMSPEQSSGERWDSRSDIYAACCVVWQCCTGSRPFPRVASNVPVIEQLKERLRVTQEFPGRPESMPSELYKVLRRGLQYDPHERHDNANEFRSHLQDAYRKWRVRVDEERRLYLARLEGFAAAIAAQRQKLSAYYLSYVELSGLTSDIEQALGGLRDESITAKREREGESGEAEDDSATFEPEDKPLDLDRIESALDNAKVLLVSDGEDDVTGRGMTAPPSGRGQSERDEPEPASHHASPTVKVSAPAKGDAQGQEGEAEGEGAERSDPEDTDVDAVEDEPARDDSDRREAPALVAIEADGAREPKRGRAGVFALLAVAAVSVAGVSYALLGNPEREAKSGRGNAGAVVGQADAGGSPGKAGAVRDGEEGPEPEPAAADTQGASTGASGSTSGAAGAQSSGSEGSGVEPGTTGADVDPDPGVGSDSGTDAGSGTGAETGGDAGTSGAGGTGSDPSSVAEARRAQWLESVIQASDQQGWYGKKASISVEPDGSYRLSFKKTGCTVEFGDDGNPERLKNCKNPRNEDWWYLSKTIKLKCKKDRCSGRYEWFDDNEGGSDSIWVRIKEPSAEG